MMSALLEFKIDLPILGYREIGLANGQNVVLRRELELVAARDHIRGGLVETQNYDSLNGVGDGKGAVLRVMQDWQAQLVVFELQANLVTKNRENHEELLFGRYKLSFYLDEGFLVDVVEAVAIVEIDGTLSSFVGRKCDD